MLASSTAFKSNGSQVNYSVCRKLLHINKYKTNFSLLQHYTSEANHASVMCHEIIDWCNQPALGKSLGEIYVN